MRWGDFDTTWAFFFIGVLVGNNWNTTIDQRQQNFFANQGLVTLVIWIDRNGGITEHGFRTGGGDH